MKQLSFVNRLNGIPYPDLSQDQESSLKLTNIKQIKHPCLLKDSSQAGDTQRFADESLTAPSSVTMEATMEAHKLAKRAAENSMDSPARITVTSSQLSGAKQITTRKFK
jgi:hypothetical protein